MYIMAKNRPFFDEASVIIVEFSQPCLITTITFPEFYSLFAVLLGIFSLGRSLINWFNPKTQIINIK